MDDKVQSGFSPNKRKSDPIITLLLRQRKARGLRQQDVADRAGISRRALVSIEAGKDCTLSTLRSLCAALDVELQVRPLSVVPTLQGVAEQRRLKRFEPVRASSNAREAKGFLTAGEMSDYQSDRELAEALKVQALPAAEYSAWLRSNWGRLQDQANKLYSSIPRAPAANARHFKTMEEKNRFDQDRETAFAVEVSMRQA